MFDIVLNYNKHTFYVLGKRSFFLYNKSIFGLKLEGSKMNKLKTPFRYDYVGSFLRPEKLKKARADFQAGNIGEKELKEVEDVGTIDSLWAANMEFLDGSDGLNLHDRSWRIFSKNPIDPVQVITENAEVNNSMIVDGCYVDGTINHSILSTNVSVQQGSQISDSVIMPGVKIGKDVVIKYAIVGENAQIGDGAVIEGTRDEIKVIGNSERIGVLPNEN